MTPSGFAFCQHCGHRLGAADPAPAPAPAATASKEAFAGTMIAGEVPNLPTPPAGMPRAQTSAHTSQRNVAADALASTMAPQSSAALLSALSSPGTRESGSQTVKTEPVQEEKIFATLIVVRRDGSDGESVRVTAPTFDIGRTEGGLHFSDDPYLATRHARLLFEHGKAILRPLDTTNGVYVRLRGVVELNPGDRFLVGKEVISWEPIPSTEHEVAITEHGVRLFGTVPRDAWGRLRQVTAAGTSRDVWHLSRPDFVLGREEGDITFPDDEFMSRRHAAVRRGSPRPKLEDLNSSNGTFLRVRTEHELKSGEMIRLGDQLLRVEL